MTDQSVTATGATSPKVRTHTGYIRFMQSRYLGRADIYYFISFNNLVNILLNVKIRHYLHETIVLFGIICEFFPHLVII